tara:strand:+ start:181 stop:384 length:204 start_codon:yes stop_codon:yes gene_type:complete
LAVAVVVVEALHLTPQEVRALVVFYKGHFLQILERPTPQLLVLAVPLLDTMLNILVVEVIHLLAELR